MEKKERGRPVHCDTYSRRGNPVVIFVTVCTDKRREILANPRVQSVLMQTWRDLTDWYVGHYVIMPDHIHLLASENTNGYASLRRWVKAWRGISARRLSELGVRPLWQRNFWDTQIRSGAHLMAQLHYMRGNPASAGLCSPNEPWPYFGQVFDTHSALDFNT